MVAHWKAQRPFLTFIPVSAKPPERTLFVSSIETGLKLLQSQHGEEFKGSLVKRADPDIHQQLLEAVRERYRDANLSLKTLSVDVHLSERYLGRILKDLTGKPFRQYLCELRISEAATLLTTTKESIKAIAGMVGYSYCSHFDEDFRSVMGCTPIEFRAKCNAEEQYDDPAAWI